MSDTMRLKIRKLLALAGNNSNEAEAAAALAKAQQLMEEHNIELGNEEDFEEQITIVQGDMFVTNFKLPFHYTIAYAVGELYGCRNLVWKQVGGHCFVGMSHQVEAAEETFLWIIAQIEGLYSTALKGFSGTLTKYQRAELRASFKDAAAIRVAQRINEILRNRQLSTSGSRALVVVNVAKEKIEEMIGHKKVAKTPALRSGFGTNIGYEAGNQVRIQKEVQR